MWPDGCKVVELEIKHNSGLIFRYKYHSSRDDVVDRSKLFPTRTFRIVLH